MKNTSLILSIISLIAVVVFGVLSLTKDGKKAEVAVEGLVYHIDAPFTYLIPETLEVLAGCRVLVPFGNGNKKKQGFVLNIKSRSEIDESIKLKSIAAVLDEVLHGLLIVIGDFLDVLHLGCILGSHVPVYVPQGLEL